MAKELSRAQQAAEPSRKGWAPWFGMSIRPPLWSRPLGWEQGFFFEVLVEHLFSDRDRQSLKHFLSFTKGILFFHSVSLNLGGVEPLDGSLLGKIRELVLEFKPKLMSDHLAFCRNAQVASHGLLPIIKTPLELDRVARRVEKAQEALGRPLALENIAAYVRHQDDTLTDLEFLDALCRKTGCGVLLDISNLYINSRNFGFDPLEAWSPLASRHVWLYHVGGYSKLRLGDQLFYKDTHDDALSDGVCSLLKKAIQSLGKRPIIWERDDDASRIDLLSEFSRYRRWLAIGPGGTFPS